MRTFPALLMVATMLYVSSDAVLATSSLKQTKRSSSDALLSKHPDAGRSLRTRGADEDDDIPTTPSTRADAQEERGPIPKAAELMRKLDLDDIAEATIVRSIMKGHPAEKTLNKMGVSPSFVTADGQKVYSKYDPGYRTYRSWVKWVDKNADWLVKDLKG
ncbi:hypothetical protein PHYBOEH_008041 [Phytophthora boehmeriae]|uniref:RxLR effector protein n=1 Tax=Phytophthora boehmeriae TaxID=109152 RepID=A0A8T1X0N6_9STRA|nr:hypothetical protein PHYBOEH_008041 [Phytophthora boehmeriae]